MTEEHAIALTKIATAIGQDARSRALTIASKEPLALATLLGESIALHSTKSLLFRAIHHLHQMLLAKVAQLILREDEMVATVDIAIEFHDTRMTTRVSHSAYARNHSTPVAERGIEELDKHLAYITMTDPLVEDCTKELTPLTRTYIEGSRSAVRHALDNGCKLKIATLEIVAEEAIEVEGIVGIVVVDNGHCIPLHLKAVENVDALAHLCPSWHSLPRATIFVVELLWSVDADAHKPPFVVQESCPFLSYQCAVGLYAVGDGLAVGVLLL